MKKWIGLGCLLILLGIALFFGGEPVWKFAGSHSNNLQGMGTLIQLLIWIAAPLSFYFGWKKRGKSPEKTPPPTENRSVKIEGGAQNNIIVIGDNPQINTTSRNHNETELRNAYLNHLLKCTRQLTLTGIDRKSASQAETCLELEAVYTALLTQSAEEHEQWLRGKNLKEDRELLSALEQLNRHQHLVLLGDPGSGKSTFINFAGLCLAGEILGRDDMNLKLLTAPIPLEDEKKEKPQPWSHGALLPVRVILRDFAARGLPPAGTNATARHLWDFITAELRQNTLADYAPFLKQTLRNHGGLLLIDGLDEVPEADSRRVQIKQAVTDFASLFPKCRLLVTSRTYAYQKQDWRLPGFTETILAPFTKFQIRRFIQRWYAYIGHLRNLNADDVKGRAELLEQAIFKNDRLTALAERPLLLTLMASLHAWRGGTLPEKREELYADTVDLLLDWWENPKIVRNERGDVIVQQPSLTEWLRVDRQKVRNLLNEIAFKAHQSQPDLTGTADVSENDLVHGLLDLSQNPDVRPQRLLEYLSQRAGLLLPRGHGIYTFPHRTFQEYLAACHLTDTDYPDTVVELVLKEPERWREVTLLAGAKAARGAASTIWLLVDALNDTEIPEKMTDLTPLWGAELAAQALVENTDLNKVAERNQRKVKWLQDGLQTALCHPGFPAIERATAGNLLAQLGDPRQEVTTIEKMEFCLVPGGPFRMGAEDKLAYDDEKPLHLNETLPQDYWISRFPVTNAQFRQFVDAGGYRNAEFWPEAIDAEFWSEAGFQGRWDNQHRQKPANFGVPFNLPNHPVVGVSWYEALAFVCWLEAFYRGNGVLPEKGGLKLPSEAEWEKAARGGLQILKPPVVRNMTEIKPEVSRKLTDNSLDQRNYP